MTLANLVRATWALYREALRSTVQSFVRGWMIAVAVTIFAALMMTVTPVAGRLGLLGGFLMGAINALLIGATLGLVEQAVLMKRPIRLEDVWSSVGQYFWDVMAVLFVLWIPLLLLEQGTMANPHGAFLAAAVFLLLFILLNPAPEVIYQVRPGSPLEVIKESYEFVLDNWVEWFLPLALLLAPFGFSFFFGLSGRLGRGAGLDFLQVLILPFTVARAWLHYLGLAVGDWLLLLVTPPTAVAMLLFRGHLFAALRRTSRRQRMFQRRLLDE